MKIKVLKKLRDLTKEEYKQWQRNTDCSKISNCEKCIFRYVPCESAINALWVNHKDLYSDKFLDQVVEIEVKIPLPTEQEKYILQSIDPSLECRYIVRSRSGILSICKDKPIKGVLDWFLHDNSGFIQFPFRDLFQFVKWEDEEPWLIKNLLEE